MNTARMRIPAGYPLGTCANWGVEPTGSAPSFFRN